MENKEKFITTKELSEVLEVAKDTINSTVSKLELDGVLRRVDIKRNSQRGYLFTEQQATLIKQEIQKHHNLANKQIYNVSTELEENQTIANAIMILQRRNKELKQRAEIAENTLNRITDGKGCYSINQTAKALKLPYGNITLYKVLRELNILNEDNTPKQPQIKNGNFKVVVKHINDKIGNKTVTLTTSKGLVYLAKKFNAEIDKSVKADF